MNETEDRIYKDLTYTQQAYFSGEQVYPTWEAIYALIVSGLFVIFFTASDLACITKLILCIVGIIFSLSWFFLVSRDMLYSQARAERIKKLEEAMRDTISEGAEKTKNVIPLFNLTQYQEEFIKDRKHKKFWSSIGTWYIRKLLPLCLSIIWLVLIIYTAVC